MDQDERAGLLVASRLTESSTDMGVSMRVVKYMGWFWRIWCDLWRFRWEDVAGPDYHRWESRMEIHRRLSRSSGDL